MIAPQLYTSRFSNRYGEEWVFEYDPSKGRVFCGGRMSIGRNIA